MAARLVELALGPPSGLVPDMGGPKVYEMTDLIGGYMRARRTHRLGVPVRVRARPPERSAPGRTLPPTELWAGRTWEEFLADQVGSSSDSRTGADQAKRVPEAA